MGSSSSQIGRSAPEQSHQAGAPPLARGEIARRDVAQGLEAERGERRVEARREARRGSRPRRRRSPPPSGWASRRWRAQHSGTARRCSLRRHRPPGEPGPPRAAGSRPACAAGWSCLRHLAPSPAAPRPASTAKDEAGEQDAPAAPCALSLSAISFILGTSALMGPSRTPRRILELVTRFQFIRPRVSRRGQTPRATAVADRPVEARGLTPSPRSQRTPLPGDRPHEHCRGPSRQLQVPQDAERRRQDLRVLLAAGRREERAGRHLQAARPRSRCCWRTCCASRTAAR